MTDPFWKSAKILFNYKRLIAMSFGGSLLSAMTFGAGLAMTLPTLHLLLEQQRTLGDLVQERLMGPGRAAWTNQLGQWLVNWLPGDRMNRFVLVMGTIIVLSVIGAFGSYIRQVLAITVSMRAGMEWRARLFRHLIRAPLEMTFDKTSGDHASRLLVDTGVMSRGYTMLIGKTVGDLLGGLAALILAISLNWRLTLIALVGMPLMGVLLRKFGKIIRRATRRVLVQQGRMIATLGDSLGNLRVVKTHNAEGSETRRFGVINKAVYADEMRARRARALAAPSVTLVTQVGITAVAVIAAWYTFRRGVPPSEFMTVLVALVAAAASVKPLARLNNQLHTSSAAAARVLEALAYEAEPTALEASRTLPVLARHRERIDFEDVGYTYPRAETPALSEINLAVRFGQTVAVVGGNGSGKTTLLSLLPGLLSPTRGRILIDGVDIATVRLRSLRDQISVVSQDAVLFPTTIAENIAYGRRHLPRSAIEAAARAAHIHEFIVSHPDGYERQLGDRGSGLSGGQRQRICIARALLRDPAIMILDEATSQIDSESEVAINLAMRKLRDQRTTFVIAHRLSTVADADFIVVMEQGRLIDQGTHDELLARCPTYQVLAQTQLRIPEGVPAST